MRDVKYYEILYELLAKQHEIARVDEAKNATLIQVVDAAIPPEKKSFPRHLLMAAVAAVFGLILGVLCAFIKEAHSSARNDPTKSKKLASLRALIIGSPSNN